MGEVVCMLNTRMRTKIGIHKDSCHQIMGFKVHKKYKQKTDPCKVIKYFLTGEAVIFKKK